MTEHPPTLTALDWIGGTVAAATALPLLLLALRVVPTFREMFAEFGSVLPWLTQLALMQWPLVLWALVPPAVLGLAASRPSLKQRRLGIVAAFLLGAAGLAAGWWALYLPIFALAGNIE